MAQPIDFLVDMLCRQNTASQCQSFINSYPDPASQLVFFVFFPLVFLIIFVHILGSGISKSAGDPKISLLISIAIFVFIVFQGWYHFFLSISKFWFIAVIILGGFYAIMHRMGPASGGGNGGSKTTRTLRTGVGDFVTKKLKSTITGEEEDLRKEIRDAFNPLERLYNEVKDSPEGSQGRGLAVSKFIEQQERLRNLITAYGKYGKTEIEIGNMKINKKIIDQAKGLWNEYEKWSEKFKKISKK